MDSNKYLLLLAIAVSLVSAQGCDFMRALAGRPTSAEINLKKAAIARVDSLLRAEELIVAQKKEYEQKVAAAGASIDSCLKSTRVSEIRGRIMTELSHRYYVVVGAFSMEENAVRLCERMAQAGFGSEIIRYSNGNAVVGAIPSDDILNLYEEYVKFRQSDFCPKDAWLLVNE